jgi:hypothetical protein
MLRVAGREDASAHTRHTNTGQVDAGMLGPIHARMDTLVDVGIRIYAPLHGRGRAVLVSRLRFAVPHWHGEWKGAFERAKQRLANVRVDGVDRYWPAEEDPAHLSPQNSVWLADSIRRVGSGPRPLRVALALGQPLCKNGELASELSDHRRVIVPSNANWKRTSIVYGSF